MIYWRYQVKFLFSLLVIIFFGLCLEALLQGVPNVYENKDQKIQSGFGYETLILGSSHAYYGINPDYFDMPTLNLANVSQSVNYDEFLLKRALDHLEDVKTVILPISYFTLYSNMDEGEESWRRSSYVQYFDYPGSTGWQLPSPVSHSILLSSPKKLSLLKKLVEFHVLGNYNTNWTPSGWGTSFSTEEPPNLQDTGRTAAKRHSLPVDPRQVTENIASIESILKACEDRAIDVILITLPASTYYREHLETRRLDFIKKTSISLTDRYSNAIYINLLEDQRFFTPDYYDADHLNHGGAEKLSVILSELIEKH